MMYSFGDTFKLLFPFWFGIFKIIQTLIVWIKFYFKSKRLSSLLNEDPAVMERRTALAKRLELYRSAQAEIDSAAWSK